MDDDDCVGSVHCPLCDRDVPVDAGLSAVEGLWMHEYECAALLENGLLPALDDDQGPLISGS
jgi:hypothetical protein